MEKQNKAQTIQQRFGFQDNELKTPRHDEIMLWLDGQAEAIARSRVRVTKWSPEVVDEKFKTLDDAYDSLRKSAHNILSSAPVENETRYLVKQDQERREYAREVLIALSGRTASKQLGPPPAHPIFIVTNKVWEYPITTQQTRGYGNKYIVGFADMALSGYTVDLGIDNFPTTPFDFQAEPPSWVVRKSSSVMFLFEVKPSIPSLGELIRQIRMYQTYTPDDAYWFVVSPDCRFEDQLRGQGIGFVAVKER